MTMPILEVKNLKKIYTSRFGGNSVQALSNVSFSVEKGEYVAIMGESGSGKSTLLNILAMLDQPTEGRVYLNGTDTSTIKNKDADVIGFQLFNSKGEEVEMYYNLAEKTFTMDRTKSGEVTFSKDFPAVTVAPVEGGNEMKLRLFVDKSSIEAFGNDGRFAMTNLVFPSEPYNRISFYAKGGSCNVTSFTVYKLGLK